MTERRVMSVGEVLLDLAAPAGCALAEAEALSMHLGGSPANVAVGLSRLGVPVSLLSSVGADALGAWIRRALAAQGVATDAIVDVPGRRTGLIFLSIAADGARSFLHARERTADGALSPRHIRPEMLHGVGLLHYSSGPLRFPHGRALIRTLRRHADEAGLLTTMDANLRPGLWKSVAENARAVWEAAAGVDLFKSNDEEALALTGCTRVEDALRAMRAHARSAAVVTLGPGGAMFLGAGGIEHVPAPPGDIVDTTGAGDACMAGLIAVIRQAGALSDDTLRRAVQLGVRMGTQACAAVGACSALPSREEGPGWVRLASGK